MDSGLDTAGFCIPLPKTNETPATGWLEDKPFRLGRPMFSGALVGFRECIYTLVFNLNTYIYIIYIYILFFLQQFTTRIIQLYILFLVGNSELNQFLTGILVGG